MALAVIAARPRRDIKSVKREQTAVAAEVRKTDAALTLNMRETERNLGHLNRLQRRVAESREAIAVSQRGVDSLDAAISRRNDTISLLNSRLTTLQESYARALRRQQLYPRVNSPIAFVFSASSVADAYRRMRYLSEYDRWRSARTNELTAAAEAVKEARAQLEGTRSERAAALDDLHRQRAGLAREEASTDSLVKSLRAQGKTLRAVLAEKQRRADALDRELDRLIAEEQARQEAERRAAEERQRKEQQAKAAKSNGSGSAAKRSKDTGAEKTATKRSANKTKSVATLDSEAAADRKLSGSFEANKGRLLFPVAGRYRIVRGYGLQNHPELKHVKTNNNGIDIEVAPGTDARAIFDGHVSAIFRLPGYANIVMVRHGKYISLYANLASTYVAKGQEVKAGQALGRILTESEADGGATTFHFELRKERAKLNPLEWVK